MLFVCRAMLLFCVIVTLLVCGACTQQRWRFAAPMQSGNLPGRSLAPCMAGGSGESVSVPPQSTPQEPVSQKMVSADRSVQPDMVQPGITPRLKDSPARGLPCSTFPSQVGSAAQLPQWQQAPAQPYVAARPSLGMNPGQQAAQQPSPGNFQPTFSAQPTIQLLPSPKANGAPCSMVSRTVGAGLDHPCEDIPSCDEVMSCRKGWAFFKPRPICQDVCSDYRNYYTSRNFRNYLYAIAGGSILANTSLDQDFRNWYQDDVRSKETDNFASFWKTFGEGEYVVPFFACTAVVGKALGQFPVADVVGEHGYRTTRAYLVGVPPMIFSQHLLGGSRPDETDHTSMWRPFEDNNAVSGHSFMGAVPFITAAQMSDGWLTKCGFYMLSTFPAWSRINDDAHYLSQTCLGWYMAYMACSSVNRTSNPDCCFEVMPVCHPRGAGIMGIWKR